MRSDARTHAVVTLACATLSVGGCGDVRDADGAAWSPEDTAAPTSAAGTDGEAGEASTETSADSTGGGEGCTPGAMRDCACPEGSTAGVQVCAADGMGYDDCACDGGETGDSTTGDPTAGDSGEGMSEVCFPGEDGAYSTCFPLVPLDPRPEGYTYPEPLNGQTSYRKPVALIDLEGLDPEIRLAPNFQLTEIARSDQGRYAIIQPHAIASLQTLRDMLGSISVTSGYRSPSSNAGAEGSDPYSRHMYGDGFDLVPAGASLSQLETACTDIGGFLVEYAAHVHCDFRNDPLDEGFFGAAGQPSPLRLVAAPFDAAIVEADGVYTTTWEGFDEGAPMHRWSAYDDEGTVLLQARGPRFEAPLGAARVTVVVGARVEVTTDVR